MSPTQCVLFGYTLCILFFPMAEPVLRDFAERLLLRKRKKNFPHIMHHPLLLSGSPDGIAFLCSRVTFKLTILILEREDVTKKVS